MARGVLLCRSPDDHAGDRVAQHDHHTAQSAAPSVGKPAIPFELKSLEGKSVGLASFRGKPLVVNFFASWCDPCREEMPLINELASKGAKDGYSVLGIAVEDSRAAVTEYARVQAAFPDRPRSEQHGQARLSHLRPAGDFLYRQSRHHPRRGSRPDHAGARQRGDEEGRNRVIICNACQVLSEGTDLPGLTPEKI